MDPQPIEDLTRLHRRATTGRQLSPAGGNVEVGREYGTDDGGWLGKLYRFIFETMTCFFSQRLGQDLVSILRAKTKPRLLGRRKSRDADAARLTGDGTIEYTRPP